MPTGDTRARISLAVLGGCYVVSQGIIIVRVKPPENKHNVVV